MRVIVASNNEEIGEIAGGMITKVVQDKPTATLGLATGSSPEVVYASMIRAYQRGEVDFSQVHTVNLDEYLGLAPDHPQSYRYFMDSHLFNHINVPKENTFVASGIGDEEECIKDFRSILNRTHVDIQLLGIGEDGHIAFNEPGQVLHNNAHVESLTESTISANARFFASADEVPKKAISMGMGDIMRASKIILIASGHKKADAIAGLIMNENVDVHNPSTMLKMHPDVTVIIDRPLADLVGYTD
ncbi:MAG TPA: glucosamine-6-phosphate deaminase [Candidatus Faecousia faecigallinarum]|nr:glucosamine-6-phosphate deaminase [Candidatus Faecousia faecigallinarum]